MADIQPLNLHSSLSYQCLVVVLEHCRTTAASLLDNYFHHSSSVPLVKYNLYRSFVKITCVTQALLSEVLLTGKFVLIMSFNTFGVPE